MTRISPGKRLRGDRPAAGRDLRPRALRAGIPQLDVNRVCRHSSPAPEGRSGSDRRDHPADHELKGAVLFLLDARMFRAADRIAGALGLFENPLRAEELARLAEKRTGLSDYGDRSFEEPLEVLLKDYHRMADLSLFGRMAARWDVLRFLSNLLQLREAERRHPEILEQPIVLPRSGSSYLHNLLAQDPGIFVPLCWETIYPCPLPGEDKASRNLRPETVDRQLARFNRLAPELSALHPMTAYSAQECTEITAHVFRSLRFETTHLLADYPPWLERASDLPAYRFHKRFLQHLQFRKAPGRWILKCPEHIFSMDSVRAVYPDASFVFMHRSPIEVLQSVAKLTEVLRQPFTRHVDRLQIGRQVSDSWARGAELLVKADAMSRGSVHPILNIHHRQLIKDPLAAARALYEHFGLPIDEQTTGRLDRFIAGRRNGGYGLNRYRPEAFGLDPQTLARRFRDYTEYFAVESEGSVSATIPGRAALRPSRLANG
jgi:hypothetical protein